MNRTALLPHLSLVLTVSTNPPAQQISKRMSNLVTQANAKVTGVYFNPDSLTNLDQKKIVLDTSLLRLKGSAGIVTEHQSVSGWTERSLVDAVVECERVNRPKSVWLGGPDVHHIYFEGLIFNHNEEYWYICWGS